MTNGEKFKTAKKRIDHFSRFCATRKRDICRCADKCVHDLKCAFEWLDLEYKEELKLCPFCGSKNIDYFETDFGREEEPFLFVIQCKDCNANIYGKRWVIERRNRRLEQEGVMKITVWIRADKNGKPTERKDTPRIQNFGFRLIRAMTGEKLETIQKRAGQC